MTMTQMDGPPTERGQLGNRPLEKYLFVQLQLYPRAKNELDHLSNEKNETEQKRG